LFFKGFSPVLPSGPTGSRSPEERWSLLQDYRLEIKSFFVITFLAKKRTPEKAFMLVTAFGGNE